MAAVGIAAYLLPGVGFDSLTALFLGTIVIGLINTLIKPIVSLVTSPLNVITLGLFGLALNGLFVLLAAELVDGFTVASFWWALAFSFVLAIVSWILHLVEGRK